jgi:hypothetical protein
LRLTASPSSCAECHQNLGAQTSWNPLGHTGPVTGLLHLMSLLSKSDRFVPIHRRCRGLLLHLITLGRTPLYDGFGGLVVSMLASGSRVRGFDPDRSRRIFFRCEKILSRGSKIICPMSQLWGMSKIPASAANCGLLAKFSSVSFPR